MIPVVRAGKDWMGGYLNRNGEFIPKLYYTGEDAEILTMLFGEDDE